jgi:hypothetical protein
MSLTLLDRDLTTELLAQVKADGYLWASLPTSMKLRYLAPFLKRQEEREAPTVAEAKRNQRNRVAA